jgi:hypothetical protein
VNFVLQIEQWPIDRLIPYARNARTHSDEQIAQVAASIVEFGWTSPILVGANGVIIAGHARLLAARRLKMAEVPVIVLGHLTEAQRRALVLADNKLALNAGWDEEMLRVELQDLDVNGFNLDLIGFSAEELEIILADPEGTNEGLTDEDAVPETSETVVTVPGDVWILGEHRVLCGDATQMEAVETVLAGGLADMVFCDPPYNVNYGATMKDKLRGTHRPIANDNLGSDFERFLRDACVNMLAVCKGALYICMSSSEIHTLQRVFREAGGHWSTFVVWAKNTFTMGRSDYGKPETRRLPYDDYGLITTAAITGGSVAQAVATASYDGSTSGLAPGDFVFVEFGRANEEHVNVISVDTVNQTFTAIVNKNHPAGSTIRPSIWPTAILLEGNDLAFDIKAVASPDAGSDLTVVIQT